MVARIKYDTTIGMTPALLESVDAWCRHLQVPRSEYCRNIIERHQRRIGLFPPPVQPQTQPEVIAELATPAE